MQQLYQQCWDEVSGKRPDINRVYEALNKLKSQFGSQSGSSLKGRDLNESQDSSKLNENNDVSSHYSSGQDPNVSQTTQDPSSLNENNDGSSSHSSGQDPDPSSLNENNDGSSPHSSGQDPDPSNLNENN